jgi:prevent-host-death family protein
MGMVQSTVSGEPPESIGIRELRQNASRYIDIVHTGHRLGVTVRGQLVAYLVPAGESDSILDRMAAVGDYRPPAGGLTDLLPVPPAPAGRRPLSDVLQEQRNEERW